MASSASTVKFESEEVIDRFLANVDVWEAIFEMLAVKDRIRLEMTHRRLHFLMFTCWKRVTSFDTECLPEMSDNPLIRKNRMQRLAAFIAICVNRIGDGLRSLTIREDSPSTVWSANFRSIGQGCANVETINFVFVNGTLDNVRFDSFSRLKTIIVSTERGGYYPSASASVFLSIPLSIEVIRGLRIAFGDAAQMEDFFTDRPSLREICLHDLYTRDESKADIFRVIAKRCPHLKSIDISCNCEDYIDYSGVVALESMKELCIPDVYLNEMQIVTICNRSPLIEALSFQLCFSSDIDLQSAVLNALGALTKLRELTLSAPYYWHSPDEAEPSLVTDFVRELARNSGSSLRHLYLPDKMPLPTAAIEALANGCAKLRYVEFHVRFGEATPASIHFLIDSIVVDPSWIPQTDQPTVVIEIHVIYESGDEYIAGRAAFKTLADPAANLPTGVQLNI